MLNQFGVWYLVGIVSAGYSCAKQYQPGIYHRVSIFFPTISRFLSCPCSNANNHNNYAYHFV